MNKLRGGVAARRLVVPICSVAASLWWTFGDRAHAHHPLLPRPALDRFTHPDPAHQTGNFVAPTPGPGGGGDPSAGAFEGMSFNGDCGGVPCGNGHPPDPNGDVGPEYYVQAINTSVGIWQKSSGTPPVLPSFVAGRRGLIRAFDAPLESPNLTYGRGRPSGRPAV